MGYNDKYLCPIHGELVGSIHITIGGKDDHHCMHCWAEWISANITKVEKVEP